MIPGGGAMARIDLIDVCKTFRDRTRSLFHAAAESQDS